MATGHRRLRWWRETWEGGDGQMEERDGEREEGEENEHTGRRAEAEKGGSGRQGFLCSFSGRERRQDEAD